MCPLDTRVSSELIAGRYIADSNIVSGCALVDSRFAADTQGTQPERGSLRDTRGLLAALRASSFTPFGFVYFLHIYNKYTFDSRS